MLIDDISTIVVEPGCTAHITANRDVRIELGGQRQGAAAAAAEGNAAQAAAGGAAAAAAAAANTECDPIQLAIFSHRWAPALLKAQLTSCHAWHSCPCCPAWIKPSPSGTLYGLQCFH